MGSKIATASYLRNFVFGVEDSLVSTVGLLSGIATANVPGKTIVLTGGILVFIEALSMAIGSFLSEHSAEDYIKQKYSSSERPFVDGVIMFFSYLFSGLIPLLPYVFTNVQSALRLSIILSLISLFILGAGGARIAHVKILKGGIRMMLIGGIAIAAGIVLGEIIKN